MYALAWATMDKDMHVHEAGSSEYLCDSYLEVDLDYARRVVGIGLAKQQCVPWEQAPVPAFCHKAVLLPLHLILFVNFNIVLHTKRKRVRIGVRKEVSRTRDGSGVPRCCD